MGGTMRYTIEFHDKRISINDEKRTIELFWNDIFSVDFYTIDRMRDRIACLSFNTEYGDFLEVTEDMQGWAKLIGNLHRYLPVEIGFFESFQDIDSNDHTTTIFKR